MGKAWKIPFPFLLALLIFTTSGKIKSQGVLLNPTPLGLNMVELFWTRSISIYIVAPNLVQHQLQAFCPDWACLSSAVSQSFRLDHPWFRRLPRFQVWSAEPPSWHCHLFVHESQELAAFVGAGAVDSTGIADRVGVDTAGIAGIASVVGIDDRSATKQAAFETDSVACPGRPVLFVSEMKLSASALLHHCSASSWHACMCSCDDFMDCVKLFVLLLAPFHHLKIPNLAQSCIQSVQEFKRKAKGNSASGRKGSANRSGKASDRNREVTKMALPARASLPCPKPLCTGCEQQLHLLKWWDPGESKHGKTFLEVVKSLLQININWLDLDGQCCQEIQESHDGKVHLNCACSYYFDVVYISLYSIV